MTEIKVIAYNTHLFYETVAGIAPSQLFHDAKRLESIIQRAGDSQADFIGFSEVWANSTKTAICNALSSKFPVYHWDGNTNIAQMGSGLLLLSRYPLSNMEFTPFDDLAGTDDLSQKGFLTAKAIVGDTQMWILQSHIQADDSLAGIEASKKARKSNLAQICNKISTLDPSQPLILLGDLNIVAESDITGAPTDEYKFLEQGFSKYSLNDVYRDAHQKTLDNRGYTYDSTKNRLIEQFAPDDKKQSLRQRIDYHFSRSLTVKTIDVINDFKVDIEGKPCDLSDHYPLRATYTL